MLDRALGIAASRVADTPEYLAGLRTAVSAGVSYGIEGVDSSLPPVPARLLVQTRDARRSGIELDVVLRQFFAGHMLLIRLLVEEAENLGPTPSCELTRLLETQGQNLDRLFAAAAREYEREAARRPPEAERHQLEHVRSLLAGELVDPERLAYELDAWHLAAIASGPGAVRACRDLASKLGVRLLAVRDDECTAWVWFGGHRRVVVCDALRVVRASWPEHATLALGEPGRGMQGWRLSHRQALAAMSVARRLVGGVASYSEVGLLASALQDDLLAQSLRDRYLAPLAGGRDGGAILSRTLAAYFAAGRNVSSAAAALQVSRQTVSIRLRTVEERIGRSLDDCAAEMEVALRLGDLADSTVVRPASS